jgi:ferritin-like metal-binding protein YciE
MRAEPSRFKTCNAAVAPAIPRPGRPATVGAGRRRAALVRRLSSGTPPREAGYVGTFNRGKPLMPAKQKTLEDLFLLTLKDVFYAEKQILRNLPKMAKAVESDELRQAFEQHRTETDGQIQRLEQIFEQMGKRASGKTCESIQGLVAEGQEIMEDFADSDALDAGVLAAAQAIEHYEISRYGTLKSWAQQLGMDDAVKLLDETLEEEKKTDQMLTKIAEAAANQKAAA